MPQDTLTAASSALRFDALSTVDPPTVTLNVSNLVVVQPRVPGAGVGRFARVEETPDGAADRAG